MALIDSDRELITAELGRELTRAEAILFENLWSEHCAYRSSRPLLTAFESEGEQVVIGPGDDAAVVEAADGVYLTLGIESHNHPSYVDPYDGAATGVGGIVRDTLSMGAYPIALADCLYFGEFEADHPRYLLEGVVEGIGEYGNAIGVPTVTGSTSFHPEYTGNPLVNVACVGLLTPDRLVTAEATEPGNKLVLVGNATGRDGLGGASFASEDLAEDAETEDRPAVQVGDPYTEKLLIEASEALVEANLIEAARDLGAAGLGGASSELVANGGLGARIDLDAVHQREPEMDAMEILLAESQERMCYEVTPDNVTAVEAIAERYNVGCSVIGELTESGQYVCTFAGDDEESERETVVDVPAAFLTEGAPFADLERAEPTRPPRDVPDLDPERAFETVLESPNSASKEWVYRQYDHEVGVRTAAGPGEDAALLALRESETGIALSAGANPNWTSAAPEAGGRAVALENATNLAAMGTTPLAAVDCLNGGNPEKPAVYGGFAAIVEGLADCCRALSVPVVGGNVSLYNDSATGPIPPTPTLAMVGTKSGFNAPGTGLEGGGELVLVGRRSRRLGGSELLARFDGSDAFPALTEQPAALVETLADVANRESTLAVHDVSDGGLANTLAEMVVASESAGASVEIEGLEVLFSEAPGRAVVETTEPAALAAAFDGIVPVTDVGSTTERTGLELRVEDAELRYSRTELEALRGTLERELD